MLRAERVRQYSDIMLTTLRDLVSLSLTKMERLFPLKKNLRNLRVITA